MITDIVSDLALGERDFIVAPIGGTPVTALTELTTAPSLGEKDGNDVIHFMDTPATASRRSEGGLYPHDALMAEMVSNFERGVEATRQNVRSKVLPAIATIEEHYSDNMERSFDAASTPVVIVRNRWLSAWNSIVITQQTERYANAATEIYKVPVAFPRVGAAELMELVKTGIPAIDAIVDDWLEDVGGVCIEEAYEHFFVLTNEIGRGSGTMAQTMHGYDRNHVMAVYLLSNGLEKNVLDNVNMSLGDYRACLTDIRRAALIQMRRIMEARNSLVNNGRLITKVTRKGNGGQTIVYVEDDTYSKFIEAGGRPEVVMGAGLVHDSITLNAANESAAGFEAAYNREHAAFKERLSANIITAQKQALRAAFVSYVNSNEEFKPELTRLLTEFNARLDKASNDAFSDISSLIMRAVCHILFKSSSMERFLDSMTEEKAKNPELDANGAATLAKIDLVARFIGQMIYQCK